MKTVIKTAMVIILMAASVMGFETFRLNSFEKAVGCVAEVLIAEAPDIDFDLDLSSVMNEVSFSSGIKPSGTYSCGVNTLEFRSNGTVISTFLGLQEKGRFRMDGSEITYIGGGIESIGEYNSENNTVTFAGMTYEKN